MTVNKFKTYRNLTQIKRE